MSEPAVLFFDAECGLCQRCVRTLLRLDRAGTLRFGPLQGPHAQAYLRSQGLPGDDFDSLVFVPRWPPQPGDRPLLRTDGVRAALRVAGGAGRVWAGVLSAFPRPIRDGGYRLVARWRRRLFGGWKDEPLEDPSWASRFIA